MGGQRERCGGPSMERGARCPKRHLSQPSSALPAPRGTRSQAAPPGEAEPQPSANQARLLGFLSPSGQQPGNPFFAWDGPTRADWVSALWCAAGAGLAPLRLTGRHGLRYLPRPAVGRSVFTVHHSAVGRVGGLPTPRSWGREQRRPQPRYPREGGGGLSPTRDRGLFLLQRAWGSSGDGLSHPPW